MKWRRRGQAFLHPAMVPEEAAVLGTRVSYPVLSLQWERGSSLLIFCLQVYVRQGRGYRAVEELG